MIEVRNEIRSKQFERIKICASVVEQMFQE